MVSDGEAGGAARAAAATMFGSFGSAMDAGDVEAAARLLIEGIYELPPGSWDGLPPDVRGMQLDNARTLPLMWNAPDWELTCEMLG